MIRDCIYNIDLIINNHERISISSDYFNHFYIANIDDNGDELNYNVVKGTSKLKANFFMIKVLSSFSKKVINDLKKRKNITGISINFTNGNIQEFEIIKKRVVEFGNLINMYQDEFMLDEDLCIIVTDKKIKYKENLFV